MTNFFLGPLTLDEVTFDQSAFDEGIDAESVDFDVSVDTQKTIARALDTAFNFSDSNTRTAIKELFEALTLNVDRDGVAAYMLGICTLDDVPFDQSGFDECIDPEPLSASTAVANRYNAVREFSEAIDFAVLLQSEAIIDLLEAFNSSDGNVKSIQAIRDEAVNINGSIAKLLERLLAMSASFADSSALQPQLPANESFSATDSGTRAALLAKAESLATGAPSANSSENNRLIGGERLVLAMDSRDDDNPGAGQLRDASGYGNHGTKTNVTFGTGQFDNAFSGDGAVRYVTVPNDPSLQIIGNQTIMMWIRPSDIASGRQNPWNKAYGGEGTMTHEPSGIINYFWGQSGANAQPYLAFNTSVALANDTWYHIALVRDVDAGNLRWVINGATTNTYTPPAGRLEAVASTQPITIGDGYVLPYKGLIDDVRYYDVALTNAEIASVMDNPYTESPEFVADVASVRTDSVDIADGVPELIAAMFRSENVQFTVELLKSISDYILGACTLDEAAFDQSGFDECMEQASFNVDDSVSRELQFIRTIIDEFDITEDVFLTGLKSMLEPLDIDIEWVNLLGEYYWGMCTLDTLRLDSAGFDNCATVDLNINDVWSRVWSAVRVYFESFGAIDDLRKMPMPYKSEAFDLEDDGLIEFLIRRIVYDDDLRDYFGLETLDAAAGELRRHATMNTENTSDEREFGSMGFQ